MRPIGSDKVKKPARGSCERAVDHAAHFFVMFQSNVLQHPHRNECITLSRNVPVIVFDEFHAAGQPQFFGAPAGEEGLFVRNVERLDGYAVTARHMWGHGAPPPAPSPNPPPPLRRLHFANLTKYSGPCPFPPSEVARCE